MIAYLDSSVLLRVILGQRNAVKEWRDMERGVASALVEVECLRTLDRLRLNEGLSDEVIALRREAVFRLLESMEILDLEPDSDAGFAAASHCIRNPGCHSFSHGAVVERGKTGKSCDGYA